MGLVDNQRLLTAPTAAGIISPLSKSHAGRWHVLVGSHSKRTKRKRGCDSFC
jgi:hypothetical protein